MNEWMNEWMDGWIIDEMVNGHLINAHYITFTNAPLYSETPLTIFIFCIL